MILGEPGAEDAYRRSIARYRDLIATSANDHQLRSAMALTYYDFILLLKKAGRTPEVLDVFPSLLELRRGLAEDVPGDTSNRISLAMLQAEYAGWLDGAGRADEAERVRRQVVSSDLSVFDGEPGNAAPCNDLAWMLASRPDAGPRDAARAVELAERAVALAPAQGAFWNTLGVVRYRAGEWSKAIAALEESMRLRSGGDPYDWLFLAMARHRLGDAAEARRWLSRSLGWIEVHTPGHRDLIRFRAEAVRLIAPKEPSAPSRDAGDRRAG
jgi:tetratricopeptide (TPR) repeat protein